MNSTDKVEIAYRGMETSSASDPNPYQNKSIGEIVDSGRASLEQRKQRMAGQEVSPEEMERMQIEEVWIKGLEDSLKGTAEIGHSMRGAMMEILPSGVIGQANLQQQLAVLSVDMLHFGKERTMGMVEQRVAAIRATVNQQAYAILLGKDQEKRADQENETELLSGLSRKLAQEKDPQAKTAGIEASHETEVDKVLEEDPEAVDKLREATKGEAQKVTSLSVYLLEKQAKQAQAKKEGEVEELSEAA